MHSQRVKRTVVVTGGGSGIGRAFCRQLAGQARTVVIIDRDEQGAQSAAAEIRARGYDTLEFAADVTDEAALKAIAARLAAEGAMVETLIACAGDVHVGTLAGTSDTAGMRADIDTDLWGTILCCRVFLPLLAAGSRVVLISSGFGLVGVAGYGAYCAAKAGVIAFGQSLRRELLHRGIRVYVACPGDTDTPMLRREIAQQPAWMRVRSARFTAARPERTAQRILRKCRGGPFSCYHQPGGRIRGPGEPDSSRASARYAVRPDVCQTGQGRRRAMTDPMALRFPTHWVGAVYQAMCVAFTPDTIRAFWEDHRTVGTERLPLTGLFRLLMDRHATVPAAYDYEVTNALELFLIGQGVDTEEFIRFASYMSSYHPYYSPEQILLRAAQPILMRLAALYDPRHAVIMLLQHVANSIMPEHIVRRVKKTGPRSHIITTRYRDAARFPFCHDYHLYCRVQIMYAPSVFGYPPFTRWTALCDARPVERCLAGGERVSADDGMVRINGKVYGSMTPSFARACRERFGLAAGIPAGADRPAALIERDYRCPVRKRVVLHKGCLYDTPYYLAEIGYDRIPVEKEDYVRRLFTLVKNADRIADKKVSEVHAMLTSRAVRVLYTSGEQRCEVLALDPEQALTPRRLVSLTGTEARILRHLAARLADSHGRNLSVSCREVIREVYGFSGDQRPWGHRSFYVALKRLIAKVNREAADGMRLRTVVHGRSKDIEISCPAGPVEFLVR